MDYTSFTEAIIVPILVAAITAGGSVTAMIISSRRNTKKVTAEAEMFRVENTLQHNENKVLIEHISNQVSGIDTKVDKLDNRLDNVQLWQVEHEKRHLEESIENDRQP